VMENLNLKVGRVLNIYNRSLSECLSRTDKFGIEFPLKADQDQKILLAYCLKYLDYLIYGTPFICLGIR
jgi:hypothetical protein